MKKIISTSGLFFLFSPLYSQVWKQYTDSAEAYKKTKGPEKVIEFYIHAKEILQKDSAGTITYAQICDSLGLTFYQKKQYTEAEGVFLESKQIREKLLGKDHADYARSCMYIAGIYRVLRKYDKAEPLYLEARSVWEKLYGKENKDYASSCNALAIVYQNTGNYKKAEQLYIETMQIREKIFGKDHADYAGSCFNLGSLYLQLMQFDKAEKLYLETKQIREKLTGKEHRDYAAICYDIGNLYGRMGKYEKAEPFYVESKQIRERLFGKENIDYANSTCNLALIYYYLGRNDEAELLFAEGKDILEKIGGKQNLSYASACGNLAMVYKTKAQLEKAETLFLESRQIIENLDKKQSQYYIAVCTNLATLYREKNKFDEAETLYLEVIEIQEKLAGTMDPGYASVAMELAGLYLRKGQYEKSEPLFQQSKQIREKVFGKDNSEYATSCMNLAILFQETGQFEKAELLLLESKDIQEKLGGKDNSEYAKCCMNMGILYLNYGKYEKAESLYKEAKQIFGKMFGTDHPDYALACNNLGTLYIDMGQFDQAEPLYLEAMRIQEKLFGKETTEYAKYCSNVGGVYQDMKMYEKAEPYYIEAKQILEKKLGKKNGDYAKACAHLGSLYYVTGKLSKAEPLYIESKEIEEGINKEHPAYAAACANLAGLYYMSSQYEKALPLYTNAKKIQEKNFGNRHPVYGTYCTCLAAVYTALRQPILAEKEYKEAFAVNKYNLDAFFEFTNEKEKAAFIKNISGQDNNAFTFYFTEKISSEHPYTLSLFHRNLILSSTQALKKQLSTAADPILINKYNELKNLKKRLSILYSKPVEERKEDAVKLEEKADQLEKDLFRLSVVFKKEQQKLSIGWEEIRKNLKDGETAIEFVAFDYYTDKRLTDSVMYVALVLRKDKLKPELVPLFEKRQLDNILAHSQNISALYMNDGLSKVNTSSSLYQLIWKPLEKYLSGIHKVYFAPIGLLHRIAFAALPVDNNQVLSDRYHLVQLNTTASVTDQSFNTITTSDNIMLFGGISYTANPSDLKKVAVNYTSDNNTRSIPEDPSRSNIWQELAGTKAEIEGIKNTALSRYKLTVLSGINATEESIKALDGTASPAILHIATHGFFFADPKDDKENNAQKSFRTSGKVFRQSDDPLLRSGLLFAGANNAWQGRSIEGIEDGILTAYEVSGMYLPGTKLVVLSACETALGDIHGSEGVYGLQRAFKIAGVQNLVMSLWKVPDTETSEFMQLFYKNMFSGESIGDAFYHAQTTMKNKYRTDPNKWAAWILVR